MEFSIHWYLELGDTVTSRPMMKVITVVNRGYYNIYIIPLPAQILKRLVITWNLFSSRAAAASNPDQGPSREDHSTETLLRILDFIFLSFLMIKYEILKPLSCSKQKVDDSSNGSSMLQSLLIFMILLIVLVNVEFCLLVFRDHSLFTFSSSLTMIWLLSNSPLIIGSTDWPSQNSEINQVCDAFISFCSILLNISLRKIKYNHLKISFILLLVN